MISFLQSRPEEVETLRAIQDLCCDQIHRELTAEVEHILADWPVLRELDQIRTTSIRSHWLRPMLIRGLCKALSVEHSAAGNASSTATITINATALKNRLPAALHAEIAAQGRLTWLRELLRGESNPSATIQCDWILNEGEVQVVLDKSEAKTNDCLAALIAENAPSLVAAVNRAFNLNSMIQARRLNCETAN
jgi:hypothetical protein